MKIKKLQITSPGTFAPITYKPAQTLSCALLESASEACSVDFEEQRGILVPSGLNAFKGNEWGYEIEKKKGDTSSYTVSVVFQGRVKGRKERKLLSDIAQVVYSPKNKSDDSLVLVEQTFEGEISKSAERKISKLYEAVKDFVLQHDVIQRHPKYDRFSEYRHQHEMTIFPFVLHLQNSDMNHHRLYAPQLAVVAHQVIPGSEYVSRKGKEKAQFIRLVTCGRTKIKDFS
ncbi:MAG: hypothetical protein ACI8Y7_000951 [Candidatus Woesearchaeota archaeon]|jgi:hypothetical protein